MWSLDTFESVDAFAGVAEPYLLAREAEHNLMLGLVDAIRRGAYDDAFLAVARRGDEIAYVALRTPPHHLALSYVTEPAAIPLLVRRLAEPRLPGVLASAQDAAHFAARYAEATGARVETDMHQRIYLAEQVVPPPPVPGRAREASLGDRDRLADWLGFFSDSSTGSRPPGELADRLLHRGDATVLIWETDAPVSMAAAMGPTPNGIRVSAVYTPPEQRGRGYASAVTAAVTQRMFDAGKRFCFLYTDLDNPTSNALYQRIGYRPVVDVDQLRFV
ncbi:MAG TPA: GNAT family N-acetyltransferase [Myxococcales bacterium]|nr:GNAT family N-acetyltransferase [Myxococcales bacterium]